MSLQFRIREREVIIHNGLYIDYDQLEELLGGHPNGISSINVSNELAAIVISRPHENTVRSWGHSMPTLIEPTTGTPTIAIGQDRDTGPLVIARITLKPGDGVDLRNQSHDMNAFMPISRK